MYLLVHIVQNLKTFVILQACYVFIMEKEKEVFIYIRDFANSTRVKTCWKFVEEFTSSEYLVNKLRKR